VAGDTIYTIACAFGDVDPNAIIVVNGLESPYTLTPGQVLQIP
jgi:LysM repeat protein